MILIRESCYSAGYAAVVVDLIMQNITNFECFASFMVRKFNSPV